MSRIEVTVTVDEELFTLAAAKGVMIGFAFEEGLRAALSRPEPHRPVGIVASAEYQRLHPEGAEARARQWAEENAEAIAQHRKFIEEHGAFGDDLRTW